MVVDFNSLYDVPKNFERLFDEFARMQAGGARRTQYPLVNVYESDNGYVVDVIVPGVTPEDIELTLTESNLIIKGERKASSGRMFRQERSSGSFQRIINMNVPVDRDNVEARSVNGILRVSIPKAEAVKPRRIAIQS